MPIQVLVAAHYDSSAKSLFDRARSFSDLIKATRRISAFDGLPQTEMEEGATYRTNIRILGLVRFKDYEIRVNKVCHDTLSVETLEQNDTVRLWSHHIQIKPTDSGAVWIDRVIIDAGRITPIVSHCARFMYRHRHQTRKGKVIEARLDRVSPSLAAKRPLVQPAE